MDNDILKAVEELRQLCIKKLNKDTVSVKIFFNAYESNISISTRTNEQLKNDNCSMQNIAGDFIK